MPLETDLETDHDVAVRDNEHSEALACLIQVRQDAIAAQTAVTLRTTLKLVCDGH